MIDFLYTNGCSWTAGNGIEQDPQFSNLPEHERWNKLNQLSWPKILSEKYNVQVLNEALGAASNKRMVRTTVDFLQNYKGDYEKLFVVLGWTTVDRNELYLEEGEKKGWILFNSTQPVSTHGASWLHGFSKDFVKAVDNWQKDYLLDIYTGYERYHQFFLEMYLMKNLLENLKIKYVFFNSLRWRNFGFPWTRTPDFNPEKEFQDKIKLLKCKNLFNLRDSDDSENVMEMFCLKNNMPMAKDHHTMVVGHRAWAEHLYTEIKKIYPEL